MRKQNFVALMVLCVSLVGMGMVSCKNDLFIAPTFGNSTGSNEQQFDGENGAAAGRFGAPTNLTATQGMYQEITLNWNPVKDAVRYYIYRANTQFESFVQVGETGDNSTNYTMKVSSGANYYYRVTAVTSAGKESSFSPIVRGTSLAQPLVSAIEGVEGKGDSDVIVYWYMGNVDAYQDLVRYNVICRDEKDTEITRVIVNGNETKETAALIQGLNSNTNYKYEVEAYLISDQNRVEKCDPIGATTARLLRPKAPDELVVEKGQSKDTVTLSFKLPSLVYVALPGGLYEEKPLYFKIYRREYVEQSTGVEKNWELLKADLGKTETVPSENELQKVDFGKGDQEYTPGDIVTWVDTTPLKRGVKYEYKVQSYAYTEREITSNFSASTDLGWLVQQANFRTDEYEVELNEAEDKYTSSTLGFHFDWDTLGLDDEYHFILTETRYSLEGDNSGISEQKEILEKRFDSIDDVNNYVREFHNLDTAEGDNVRGYYYYTLTVLNKNNTELLVVESPGRAIVTEAMDVPVITKFAVTSGYNDKIELSWKHNELYTYTVKYFEDEAGDGILISQEELYGGRDYSDDDDVTYIHSVSPGKKYSYVLSVTQNISTDSLPIVGRTSVAPVLKGEGYSYDSIAVTWQDVPATDFIVTARYTNSTWAERYPIESQVVEGKDADALDEKSETREVVFEKPNGYDHANVSGSPVEITITANVQVTETVHTLSGTVGSSYEISTNLVDTIPLTHKIEHNTVGPAMVNASAGTGVHSDKIDLTWKEVPGATAYMVIRSGFHISSQAGTVPRDNKVHLNFQSTDKYLVQKSNDGRWTVTHKPSEVVNEAYFSVTRAEDGTFTLSDKLYIDTESALNDGDKAIMGQWIARQEQLSWGAPYKYSVLPIIENSVEIEYDYEESPSLITLNSIRLTDLPLSIGTTKGYAWNVKATKGTYSKNGQSTGVQITWTRPFTPSEVGYNVYRAESTDAPTWKKLEKPVELGQTTYVDEDAEPGVMYQYMVATGVDNEALYPNKNVAWVAHHNARLDDDYEGERLANGFILPRISFSVTRSKVDHNDSTGGKESLSWTAPLIAGNANYLFDGYIIELLNHNISGEWQRVAKLDFGGSIQNLANYTYTLGNENGLLKVLRDYKHYFRIRTYTIDENGEEVLSMDDYQWADGYETKYVKWGARSLSADEFARVALVALGDSMVKLNVSKWDASCNNVPNIVYDGGISWGCRWFDYQFESYQSSLKTVSGKTVNSVKITGKLGAHGAASGQWPTHYWTCNNDGDLWATSDESCPITIVFSALPDESDIKTGTIHLTGVYRDDKEITSRSKGEIKVSHAGYAATINQSNQSQRINIPFPYYGDDGFSVYNSEEWK